MINYEKHLCIFTCMFITEIQRNFSRSVGKSIPLVNDCTKFYINVVGPGRMEDVIPKNDKIVLSHYSDDPTEYEFPTQHLLREKCKQEECYVCYYHLRGVTSPLDNLNVVDNRNYLIYFIVEQYKLCLQALENGCDAVSVDTHPWPTFHFSSNMWWAKSEHINSLVAMEDLPGIPNFYAKEDRKHRHRCEMWITSNPNATYGELWNSEIHPSRKGFVRYPPEKYRHI